MAAGTASHAAPLASGNLLDRWFTSSDGVRLHYTEGGRAEPALATLVFVPGWTMPGWIWQAQLAHFAQRHRVIAFDPRGQGQSAIAVGGYDHQRRAADIAELLAAARCENVVLVGWSLGVLESLRYLSDARTAAAPSPVRGLVLVDNSVGEGEAPAGNPTFFTRLRQQRQKTVRGFVHGMFKRPAPQAWLDDLVAASLRMPLKPSMDLLRQATPREFWRETLYALDMPVLYAYTPRFAGQADLVKQRKPSVDTRLFSASGHALFVDDAEGFNQDLERFVARVASEGRLK